MKVHCVNWIPIPNDSNDLTKDAIRETMKNKIFKWSQKLFCHQFWTSHKV